MGILGTEPQECGLDATQFYNLLNEEEVILYLAALNVHASEAAGLFCLLDSDCSGRVEIGELVSGLLRLKGGAKAVDMVTLLHENKKLSSKMNELLVLVKARPSASASFNTMNGTEPTISV